jgi:hypothetical protein
MYNFLYYYIRTYFIKTINFIEGIRITVWQHNWHELINLGVPSDGTEIEIIKHEHGFVLSEANSVLIPEVGLVYMCQM